MSTSSNRNASHVLGKRTQSQFEEGHIHQHAADGSVADSRTASGGGGGIGRRGCGFSKDVEKKCDGEAGEEHPESGNEEEQPSTELVDQLHDHGHGEHVDRRRQ